MDVVFFAKMTKCVFIAVFAVLTLRKECCINHCLSFLRGNRTHPVLLLPKSLSHKCNSPSSFLLAMHARKPFRPKLLRSACNPYTAPQAQHIRSAVSMLVHKLGKVRLERCLKTTHHTTYNQPFPSPLLSPLSKKLTNFS